MTTSTSRQNGNGRRGELRDFLRSRRARITPEDVGLPGGGRRRTPGLRREEVAVLAGVGSSWYMWLEQGRDIKVSEQVLDAIARALRMSEAERAHLYRLAGLNPPRSAPSGRPEITAELRRVLETWLPNPAYVLDRWWNVVAVNDAAEEVFSFSRAERNCLVAYFTAGPYRSRFRAWEQFAPTVVAQFRADAADHADDPRYAELVAELSGRSPEFAELWNRHDVLEDTAVTKVIDHPVVGCLTFEHSTLRLASRSDMRLILQSPQPGTDTAEKVGRLLARREARAHVRLAETG
ncbi:helix-turn-helix transcriptional regulator [Streptomyces sp. NPDC004284]|uniref:helix-turn-helix transcriptional regulator n=1 Tax=Streptomyces sp. NPDC004284 TaxID=3364695 RepID=UPI00368D6651